MLDVIMALLSRILVPLFIIGMAGSSLVVVITLAHDIFDYFAKEDGPVTPGTTR